jgi:hypothetical protein
MVPASARDDGKSTWLHRRLRLQVDTLGFDGAAIFPSSDYSMRCSRGP